MKKVQDDDESTVSESEEDEHNVVDKNDLRNNWIQQQVYLKCQEQATVVWDDFTSGNAHQKLKMVKQAEEEKDKKKEKKDRKSRRRTTIITTKVKEELSN